MNKFEINNLENYRANNSTYIIAEIGQAHDGSLGILHSLLEAVAALGVDAIKFQMHIANAESSEFEPFRKKFSYQDKTRYDYWERMEFSIEEWKLIKKKCETLGVEFLATPFSNKAVDNLEIIGVSKYKIGSGDINNKLLIDKIIKTGKEIILSTGLVSQEELEDIVFNLKSEKLKYSLLQCTSKYPTEAEEIGLDLINSYKERYNCPVGLSDHSGNIYSALGAVALGANIIEAHVCFDKRMFGPDSIASLDINEFSNLVNGIRFLEKARLSHKVKNNDNDFYRMRKIFGKSLALNRDFKKGEIISFNDLEGKKPVGKGIAANDYDKVIGKKLNKNKSQWDFINYSDLI